MTNRLDGVITPVAHFHLASAVRDIFTMPHGMTLSPNAEHPCCLSVALSLAMVLTMISERNMFTANYHEASSEQL